MHSTATKQNIRDIESDSEGETPTKKPQQLARGRDASQHQQKLRKSASPITPPKGPRKQTNEHPGLIGKRGQCTNKEVAAEQAAKEAKIKAMATAKSDTVTDLVEMELDQEQQEATCRQCILWRQVLQCQPSVLDVTADSSGEEFNWGSVDSAAAHEMVETDVDTDCGALKPSARAKQTKVSITSNLFE